MGDFTFDFVSRNDCRFLVVEISYCGQILCQIDSEHGIDQLEVEFAHESRLLPGGVPLKFSVAQFMDVFAQACAELIEVNKVNFE
ncbi:hypothetical protein FHR56_003595 [Xanthomonas sacchari]|uniref:hypothetical protein n=1 Tax=unclassified Xanthomonas TaxID=2643310 RepID=UPI00136EABFE|nr:MULTISPECIES: hypothetical protein [unclassified Xanthomonas]MBB6368416.1 hypothetical protein [Xanthomonas sp. F10]